MAGQLFAEQGCSFGRRTAEEQIVQRIDCKKLEKEVSGEGIKLEVGIPGILQGAITLMSGLRP